MPNPTSHTPTRRAAARPWDEPIRREPRATDLEVIELADLLCLPRRAALRVYAVVEA